MKKLCLLIGLAILPVHTARAWWSMEPFLSTHKTISEQAVLLVNQGEYPDINKFSRVIIDATTTPGIDAIAHGKDPEHPDAGKFNGGDYEQWWKDAQDTYKKQEYSDDFKAYFRIGSMAHLVQDQAVPAHADNIYHGQEVGDEGCFSLLFNTIIPCDPDELEKYASWVGLAGMLRIDQNVPVTFDGNPLSHYYNPKNLAASMIYTTQIQTEQDNWRYPALGGVEQWRGRRYWYPNGQEQYGYTGQAFFPNSNFYSGLGWGAYGGPGEPGGKDMYASYTFYGLESASGFIAHDQLNKAIRYTAGMLMAVSKSLPPIVTNAAISAPNIVPGQSVDITFTVLENRTPAATIYLLLDEPNGNAIISSEYQSGKNLPTLYDEYAADKLPYGRTYTIPWDGKMANGEYAPSGSRKIYIKAKDVDGNESDAVAVDFNIDTGGPMVTIGNQIAVIYANYQGISKMNPACTNPYMAETLSLGLTVDDPSSGVRRVALIGPAGTAVYSKEFPTPTATYSEPALPTLADGQYKVTAEDWDGNTTEAQFRLGSLSIPTDKAGSSVFYNPATNKFSVTLKVNAKSYFQLVRAELLDAEDNPLESRELAVKESPLTFALSAILDNTQSFPSRNYNLRLTDTSGQRLTQNKSFAVWESSVAMAGVALEKYSALTDLMALGLLPGGAASAETYISGGPFVFVPGPAMSGYMSDAPEQDTQITLYVQTGDEANALGGEMVLGIWNNNYRVFSAGSVPPDNCGGIGLPLPSEARLLCWSKIINKLPIKRYVKFRLKGEQDRPAGVYACSRWDPDNPGYCVEGVGFPELVVAGNLWGVVRGVRHFDSMTQLTGAPGVNLPAGTDVTAKISEILTATFGNVSQAGLLSAVFVTPADYPGTLPLTSFGLDLVSGQYSGQVRLGVKYSAALSPGQEAGIEAFQGVFNPEINRYVLRPIAAQVDTGGKEVFFSTGSLGAFQVTAPKYATPNSLKSPELSDGLPEYTMTSNSGSLTQRMVVPGSPEAQSVGAKLAANNLFAVGNIFYIGPDGTSFTPDAAVKMKYSDSDLAARGIFEDTLALYEFNSDLSVIFKLSGQVADISGNEIAGEVSQLHSMFAILGSSRAVPVQLGEDRTPPVTNAIAGVPPYRSGDTAFVSTETYIFLDAWDPKTEGSVNAGVKETYYVLDPPAGQTDAMQLFSQPFTLAEGIHHLYYRSVDNQGNLEAIKSATFYADGTAPASTAAIVGQGSFENGALNITEGSSIAVTGADIEWNGVASGLGAIYVAVSTFPCADFSEDAAGPGICHPVVYTGPFAIPMGNYYFYHIAMDNVGNHEVPNDATVSVRANLPNPATHPFYELSASFGSSGAGPGQFGAYGMKFDRDGNLLVADQGNLRIQKFTPAGEFISMFSVNGYGHSYFYSPLQVAPCPNGDIWVSDYGTKLLKFAASGAFVREMYIQGLAGFSNAYPKNIVCSPENELYFLTWGNYIFRLDSQGNKIGEISVSNSGSYLNGLARDNAGNLYTYHSATGKIRKYGASGGLLAEWASVNGAASLDFVGVSVDSFDNVYLSRFGKPLEIYTSTGGLAGSFSSVIAQDGAQHFLSSVETVYNPGNGNLYLLGGSRIDILHPDFRVPATPVMVSPSDGATVLISSPLVAGQSEISSLVRVYDSGTLLKELTTNATGYFSFNLPNSTYGEHMLTAQAYDAAGNQSGLSPVRYLRTAAINAPVLGQPIAGPTGWSVWETSATVTGDFDGDGIMDVVGFGTVSGYGGAYVFYKGLGNGSFVAASSGGVVGFTDDLEAVAYDFNNDGLLDVVAAMTSMGLKQDSLVFFKGQGNGSFDPPVIGDSVGFRPDMAVADMDKDGYSDLVLSAGEKLRVYWGNAVGDFLLSMSTGLPAGAHTNGNYANACSGGMAVADFDLDGNMDVVFRNAVMFGSGRGGFVSSALLALPVPFSAEMGEAQAADLNGDGLADIVLAAAGANKVLSYINLGGRKFMPAGSVSVDSLAYESVAVDLNADGLVDIALSPAGAGSLYVLAGRGDGTFSGPYKYSTGGTPAYSWGLGGLSAADLNLDGKKDIVLASPMLYLPGRTVNSFMVFLNQAQVPDWTAPAASVISAAVDGNNGIVVQWTAPGDDNVAGRAALYDLRYALSAIVTESAFSAATPLSGLSAPKPAGQPESLLASGLSGGATYYFALRSSDEAGNLSALSNSPGAFIKFVFTSTSVVNDLPEMTFTASTQASAALISTISAHGSVALGVAAGTGLTLASNLYEIGPEGEYDPPASLTFAYSTAAITALGLQEDDIGIYEYFSGIGWVSLGGQVPDGVAHTITVPVTRIASLFAIFGTVKDRTPPVTNISAWCPELMSTCPSVGTGGAMYVGAASSISLAAYDPVMYGTSTGVSFTEFRLDDAGSDQFAKYSVPLALLPGPHRLECRSADHAGNLGQVFVIDVFVDAESPAVTISSPSVGGVYSAGRDMVKISFQSIDNSGLTPTYSAVLVQAEDKGSPRGARPGNVSVSSDSVIAPMDIDDGMWRLDVVVRDVVGNSTQAVSGLFEVVHDTITPQTTLLIGEPQFTDTVTFINSGTPLLFSATDDLLVDGDRQGSGVGAIYVSLDAGIAVVVPGEFFVSSEGVHNITYFSVDKAGNTETTKSAVLSVDNSAPETTQSVVGPVFEGANGLYISTASVVNLAAVEPPSSGAASGQAAIYVADSTDTYKIYIGTFTALEGAHLYSYYAKDRLGNAGAVKTLALTADGTPPVSAVEFSIAPSTETSGRLTISSDTYMGFAGADALSGVKSVTYSIDGATPAVFASSFTLVPGAHTIAWWSVDNVGNVEPAQAAAIQVRGLTELSGVTVNFEPSVINLKSEGKYVEARLAVSSATGPGFYEDSIRITRVNDVALASPIYAMVEHARGHGKNDKSRERKHSVSVKFDRQALIAVLPVDRMVKVTVEGSFDDDTAFMAEDYLRVINPGRIGKGHGGKVRHHSKACADIPSKGLKEDTDITVVAMYERDAERREREDRAGAKGLKRHGDIYEFGPEGTVFDAPVTISLPYEPLESGKEKPVIAYWNPSKKDWEPLESELDAVGKVVKAKVGHFSLYQVVVSTPQDVKPFRAASAAVPKAAGPSADFRLGEVYVYPNPAKGSDLPVFHMECGIADSVNIKIYTVSGREAHEVTLTALPQVIDDGNGQSYAYEYAWRGHIPSGVYLYYIEAQKGGQKLKKTGKFAVVR